MNLESIGKGAESILKGKTFGGVSRESALEAINNVRTQAMNAIGNVQKELESIKGKTAQEIAELTSKNDRLDLQLKNVKNARSSEKVLANGDKIIRKVNPNGAVMEKQLNSEGKVYRVEVTTLDGAKRRTTYNPTTGKPIKTYTDTTGEGVAIEYNNKGDAVLKQKVNDKKTRRTQAKVIKTDTNSNGTIQKIYSDGSIESISTDRRGITTIVRRKGYDTLYKQIEGKNGVFKLKVKMHASDGTIKFANNNIYKEASMTVNNNEIIKAETKTLRGETYKLEKITNRFGQDTHSYKVTESDASGNTSFDEISEVQIKKILSKSGGNVLNVGNAKFFPVEVMIDMISR